MNHSGLPWETICEEYRTGGSAQGLSQKYGCARDTMSKMLRLNGVQIHPMGRRGKLEALSEQIADEYRKGNPSTKIAKKYNCAPATIMRILRLKEVKTRRGYTNPAILPQERIREKYSTGTTIKELAIEYGCAEATVLKILRLGNTKMRTSGEWKRLKISSESIVKDYFSGMSAIRIGKKYGIGSTTVYRLLEQKGIVERNTYKGEKNAMWHEKHPRWMGGLSYLPYSPDFSIHLKKEVKTRDNFACQLCGKRFSSEKLDVHHIDYNKNNSKKDNLITLCDFCHSKTTNEGNRKLWEIILRPTHISQLEISLNMRGVTT